MEEERKAAVPVLRTLESMLWSTWDLATVRNALSILEFQRPLRRVALVLSSPSCDSVTLCSIARISDTCGPAGTELSVNLTRGTALSLHQAVLVEPQISLVNN
jgi:hypothetical protein